MDLRVFTDRREEKMGTKYLARTVIEGGRSHHNCWERRWSHRTLRARERMDLERIAEDPELADATPGALLQPVPKDFHDKLGPAVRWLRSQVGRRWDRIRSEIARKFDVRTIPGQHIVFDHLLEWVELEDDPARWWRPRFVVDAQGVLREPPPRRWAPRRPRKPSDRLDGELVLRRGSIWFWFVPTFMWKRGEGGVPTLVPTGRYRQDRALTAEEAKRFEKERQS